jgi:uncharacterized cupin superfamily protein
MIHVEKPTEEKLKSLNVEDWPIWKKEISEFDWEYDEDETCYLLEGDVIVTPKGGGTPVRFGKGDLVIFKTGLKCAWKVLSPVKKHYKFG